MQHNKLDAKSLVRSLILIFGVSMISGGAAAETYFALHYTSAGKPFGVSPTVDTFNPCIYDNVTSTSPCPSIADPDNASLTTTATQSYGRYFEESIRPAIGTLRFAVGYNKLTLWDYIGFRVGGVFGLLRIRGQNSKTYMEGFGPLGGYEVEIYGNKDPLKFLGLYPFFRYTQYRANLIPIYFLGENLSGQRYVRKNGDIFATVYEYGASIKISFGGFSGKGPKAGSGKSGFFFDVMKSDTQAQLLLGDQRLPLKTVVTGFSLKFSAAL